MPETRKIAAILAGVLRGNVARPPTARHSHAQCDPDQRIPIVLRLEGRPQGDVHREMGLFSAMPAVCSAIGSRKFEEASGATIVKRPDRRTCERRRPTSKSVCPRLTTS